VSSVGEMSQLLTMKDQDKTKEQLIKELSKMRQRIAELEALESECRRSEEALRENEESFRTLIEKSVEAVYLVNFDTEFVFWNRAAEEMMALTPVPSQKITLADVLTPDSLKVAMENVAHAAQTGTTRPQPYELTVRKFDGTLATLEVFIGLVEHDGKPHMLGTARDITERKQREAEIEFQKKRLESLVKNSPLGIVTMDEHNKILSCNSAFEEIFQYKEFEVLGRDIDELVTGEKLIEEAQALTRKTTVDGVPSKISTKRKRKDATWIDIEVFTVPIKIDGKLVGQFGMYHDITKRKRVESELISSREQLRNLTTHLQSLREEESARIAREVHDELGQQLIGLKMDLYWLRKRLLKNQKSLHEKIKVMLQLIDTAIQTVREISTRLRPKLLDDLGLLAAVEWQTEEFQNRTGIKCEVIVNRKDIILDKDLSTTLFRVFQEALMNVARHANAKGVKVSLKEKAGKIELKVRDNGKGITEEKISRHNSFGLIGIRERVRKWNGEVKISGIRNKGTTVTVIIPLDKE